MYGLERQIDTLFLIIALFSRIGLWVHKTIIKPVINIMINNNYKDTSGMVYTFSRRQHVGIRNLNRCLKYRNKQNHDTITYSRGRYKYEESISYKNWEMLNATPYSKILFTATKAHTLILLN